jgi:hypothetical protein
VTGHAEIALPGTNSYAHNLIEVRGIFCQPEIDRSGRGRGGPERHYTLVLKEPQEMVQPFGRFRKVTRTVPPEPDDIAL